MAELDFNPGDLTVEDTLLPLIALVLKTPELEAEALTSFPF